MERERCVKNGYVALISVLIVGAIGLSVAVALLFLGLSFTRTSSALEQSGQARALANACAEEALKVIRITPTFSGTGNLTISPGTCSYSVSILTGEARTVNVSGNVGSITRKVKISVSAITPFVTVSSWQEVADS